MRTRLILVVLAVIGLVASACTGGSDSSQKSGSSKSTAPAGKAVKGGSLTVGTAGELVSFDPAKISGFGTLVHPLLAVYDTLLRLDNDGHVIPNIATSMTPSADLKTWTMKLTPGVKFSDGSALDATAVRTNVLRHQDPAVKSQSASLVKGIAGIKVVDATTVEFDLSQPDVAFNVIFTLQPGLMAAPSTLKSGYPLDDKPIGAGPFVLVNWQRDSRMQLKRNDTYFQKGLPYLDSLQFRPVTDTTTRLSSLRSGDMQLTSFIDQPSVNAASKDSSLATDAAYGNGGDVLFLNTRKKPLNDVKIRKALAEAIDPAAVNAVLFGGKMNPANGPFASDSPYALGDTGYPKHDEADAKALLKQYKSESGDSKVTISFLVNNVPDRLQLAQLIQGMWQKVGFSVTIDPVEAAQVSARFASFDFQVAARNIPGFADPDPLLSRWFFSTSPLNYSGINDPALDAAFDQGKSTADQATRVKAYQTASRELASTLPVLWYAHGVRGYAHSKKVTLGPNNLQDVLWYQQIGLTG